MRPTPAMKAPTSTVGSRPALISRCPSSAVVVDFPCVPVTARPMRPGAAIISPSSVCHGTTGRPPVVCRDQLGKVRMRAQGGGDRHAFHAFQMRRIVPGDDPDAGGRERRGVRRRRVRITAIDVGTLVVRQQRDPGGARAGDTDDVDPLAAAHHAGLA